MNGCAAQGSVVVSVGVTKTKRCGFNNKGCSSLQVAKRRVVKGLANMLRAYFEGTEGWTEWPKLASVEQKKWLDKVAETLQWDELQGGKVANLRCISASEFSRALVGSLA